MSDILIRGMEMPTRCYTCPCADLEFYDCNLMPGTRIEQHKRLDDCPLVPVPSHGRLIDADAAIDKVIAKYLERERKGELVFAAAEIKQDIVDLISDAPTIIPAEEG